MNSGSTAFGRLPHLSSRPLVQLRVLVSALFLLAAAIGGLSSTRAQQIQGFGHRHWDTEEGSPPDIRTMAQTRDGFMWLGTSNGLYRFDGISFEKIEPSTYNRWRSNQVTALAAAPDGALWVGYDFGGIGVYRDGRLSDASPEKRPGGSVWSIAVGGNGDVWVATNGNAGAQLKRLHQGRWQTFDDKGWLAQEPIQRVFVARDGTLWIAQYPSILRLSPGAARPQKVDARTGLAASFTQDQDQRVWFADSNGLQQLTGPHRSIPIQSKGPTFGGFGERSVLVEDGIAWIAGNVEGLIRIPLAEAGSDKQEVVPVKSGFLLRDREGTVWGGGPDGLVRYVRSPILVQPLDGPPITGFAATLGADRSLLVGTDTGVYRLGSSQPRLILKETGIVGLCTGPPDQLWVMAGPRNYLLQNGAWSRHDAPTNIYSPSGCAIGPRGEIWEAARDATYRLDHGRWALIANWPSVQLIASDGGDGLFATLPMSAVFHLTPQGTKTLWSGEDIAIGFVKLIKKIGPYVYLGGEKGLARYDGKRFVTLEARFHPWLSGVSGLAIGATDAWLIGNDGIVRISRHDMDQAFNAPQSAIPHRMFGSGLGFVARKFAYMADDAALDAESRPWFVTGRGVVRLDLARVDRNTVSPPVTIRELSANGRSYRGASATLPAGTSRVQFDFVALSLTDPSSNSYRYRLDGVDGSWVDAGGKRQANYTGLGPGTYRFQVIAANPDGVWNGAGAAMTLTIKPFFWQTWLFKGGLLLLAFMLLWAFVQWRIRIAAERTRQRIEDRLAVREHIAQELHDTLLQGFQGLVLRFQSIMERLPFGHPARAELESTLERADDVLQEGRDRVRFLREETEPVALAPVLSKIAKDVLEGHLRWTLKETGIAHPVCAPVADDIARIANEAIFNALRHAHASALEIAVAYARDGVTVSIKDDGIGIDPAVKQAGRKEGHYGLVGMHERATRLGAGLRIIDASPSGTEIRLTIPGRIAYR